MTQTSDENIWGLIAWILSIVGAILVLVLKPNSRYAKYWAYLSVSFFIIFIVGLAIISLITIFLSLIPFLGTIVSSIIQTLYYLFALIVWIIGILKSVSNVFWKPRFIYDLALKLGIENV